MVTELRSVDVTGAVRLSAAALLCRRLLRALAAATVCSAALVSLLTCLAALVGVVAAVGWRAGAESWRQAAWAAAVTVAIGLLALLALAVEMVLVLWLARVASRGSVAVGRLIVLLALIVIGASAIDLAHHVRRLLTAEAAGGREVVAAAMNLFPLYVAAAFVYAGAGVARLARHPARDVLVAPQPDEGWRAETLGLAGWPETGLPKARRRRAGQYAVGALGCEGMAFSTYFVSSAADPPDLPLSHGLILVATGWPVAVATMYGLLVLADWLWRRSRQAAQMSLTEILATDPRAPVLFLRSFADDHVSLKAAPVPLYLRALDPGVSAHQFEELVVSRLSKLGPVIAIGRPSDARRPIGAARAYLADRAWQPYVTELMAHAQVIVVSLSLTDGLAWELVQIRERGHLGRTLLVVPPDLTTQPELVAERALDAGFPVSTSEVASGSGIRPIACWATSGGAPTIILTSRLNELAYDLALRMFLRHHADPSAARRRQ